MTILTLLAAAWLLGWMFSDGEVRCLRCRGVIPGGTNVQEYKEP